MRKELFDQLVESVNQMKEIQAGRLKPSRVVRATRTVGGETPDVAKLRGEFGLNQGQFAALLGISVDTLQNWEQGRRNPEGPARVLLRVAASHPEALLAVSGARHLGAASGANRVAEQRVGYSPNKGKPRRKPARKAKRTLKADKSRKR